jgi:bis(5'-nucleosidyl)-tetraphosphatase
MTKEISAGAVVFRRQTVYGKESVVYLVLHYRFKGDYWDFPRGKIEKGETELQTARREIKEETDLSDIGFLEGFAQRTNWYYRLEGKNVYKEAVYFLAEAKGEKETVHISKEHIEHLWLEFDDAMKRLTYKNTRAILQAAHEHLGKAWPSTHSKEA